jgi:hypothetical protein
MSENRVLATTAKKPKTSRKYKHIFGTKTEQNTRRRNIEEHTKYNFKNILTRIQESM